MDEAKIPVAYVTGIAGFLGSRVAGKLLELGFEVYGCDNFITGSIDNIPLGVNWKKNDIRNLAYIDMPQHCDVVVHTAAIARSRWPDDDEIESVNIAGTKNVLRMSNYLNSRFVYCSSCVADKPQLNTYAHSKYMSELDVLDASGVALRYSNIYGLGQSIIGPEPNVLAAWEQQRVNEGTVRVYGDGSQTRDFVHVSDAANATVIAAINSSGDGWWFDVCTGVQTPIIDIAWRFNVPITYAERPEGDPDYFDQDPVDIEEVFQFRAQVPLHEGLRELGL